MVKYNPHAPVVLGFEWVGIREENYIGDTTEEVGYTFTLPTSATVVSGGIVVADPPPFLTNNVDDPIFIYPAGSESNTGPIQEVIIPIKTVAVSGDSTISVGTNPLLNTNDFAFIQIAPDSGGGSAYILMFFDVASYAGALSGKRIVDVSLRYIAWASSADALSDLTKIDVAMRRPATATEQFPYSSGIEGEEDFTRTQLHTVSLGHMNPFWSSTGVNNFRVYPFRYNELSATDWCLVFLVANTSMVGSVNIGYAALSVKYCEEQRVGYGGTRIRSLNRYYTNGLMAVPLKDVNFNDSVSLTAGQYTVTTIHHNEGGTGTSSSTQLAPRGAASMAALRQYYEIPNVSGTRVQYVTTVGDTFTQSESDVIPPITLYTSSAVVTGTHAYSDQVAGPVYGSISVIQEIDQSQAPSIAANYTQVRFYARRFGNTTNALTITGIDTAGTPTASITPTAFDTLSEIVDGWKEVTLRLTPAASYSTSTSEPRWEWASLSETAGNRWEILGTSVPFNAVSGTYGASQVSYNDYESATVSGTNVLSTWKQPNATTESDDRATDFVIILSQDPPTVSGLAVTEATQSLTAVVDDCGVLPDCIPTGLTYHAITWLPVTSVPATGFGAYELQRIDAHDDDWNTIMLATSPVVTGFSDYEARVGVQSRYRIRMTNVLDFAGSWSAEVSNTLTAPGITGTDGNGVLIFTTNEGPTGNLAHTMMWARDVDESFSFPEADTRQLVSMYGRDFPVAFRPLERGGEQFSRLILVQAAAIPVPSLGNFRSLRDLAWDDVSYICVRDELGNRWYANVNVPAGSVRRNRTLYFARVDITEVASVSSIVTVSG